MVQTYACLLCRIRRTPSVFFKFSLAFSKKTFSLQEKEIMVLEISDNIVQSSQMTEAEIRLELAILLFAKNRLTLGQARELADIDQDAFEKILIQKNLLYSFTKKTAQKRLSLNIEKFPKNIADVAVKPAQLAQIVPLFEDAPSAEELCKML